MKDLQALVIGCSKGLGRAMVLLLKNRGYRVTGVSRTSFSELDEELRNSLNQYYQLNLADREAMNDFLSQSMEIDCLVLNACSRIFRDFSTFSDSEILKIWDSDFTNQVRIVSACIPYMKRENRGQIIFISSRSAVLSYSTGSLYCSVKSAWRSFYFSLIKEFKHTGMRFFLFVPDAFSNGQGKELPNHRMVIRRLNLMIDNLNHGKSSRVFLALSFRSRIQLMLNRILFFLRHAF